MKLFKTYILVVFAVLIALGLFEVYTKALLAMDAPSDFSIYLGAFIILTAFALAVALVKKGISIILKGTKHEEQ